MIYLFVIFYTMSMGFLYTKSIASLNRLNRFQRYFANTVLLLLLVMPMIFVSGFRYGISVDYIKVYERGFNSILNSTSNLTEFETGFYYLVKLLSLIIHKEWFIFFGLAFITILVFFLAFKESENYFISLILFFCVGIYFDSFNGVRQYLVVSIFLYCYKYIKNQNFIRYFVIMSLCGFLHISALFTLPLYFIDKVRFNKKGVSWKMGRSIDSY